MASVLITTLEVFTRVSPNNSLERLTKRSVGFITDRPSDVCELLVTLLQKLHRLLHSPFGHIFQRRLPEQFLKSYCECGARHARCFSQGFDRPGCIHTIVNSIQGSANLGIENST